MKTGKQGGMEEGRGRRRKEGGRVVGGKKERWRREGRKRGRREGEKGGKK